jgi:hypothetical protein
VLFLLLAYYGFTFVLYHAYHYFCTCRVPTISVLILAISPATQTCCSENEDGVEFLDEVGLRYPGCISMWIMEPFAVFPVVRVI